MTRVVFSAAAQVEVRAARQFYAERFAVEMDRAITHIAASPTAWPMVSQRLHRYVLRRFPYFVLFHHDGDDVLIAAVAHQRQNPARWRDR